MRFGAKGNGTDDDTTAIQSAFDAAVNSHGGGRRIYFPRGTYRITKTLQVTRGVGVLIEGAGEWSTIVSWDGPPKVPMLRLYNTRDSCIQLMYWRGNSASPPTYVIESQGDSTDRSALTPT